MNRAPAVDPDLHGSVPDSSPVALLLIDVINDLTFEGAEALLPHAIAMRDYTLIVPADCVASNTLEANRHALQQMAQVLKADVTPSDALDLRALVRA